MEQKSNAFLETESVGALMRRYAVPCIISLLVGALYNIVDCSYYTLCLFSFQVCKRIRAS